MYAYRCTMRKLFRIIKRFFQFTIITFFTLLASLYIALSLPSVQKVVCDKAEDILSETLEVPVTIAQVKVFPFNRVEVYNVHIPDEQGNHLIKANKIGAGIDLLQLLFDGRISLNNIQVFGLDGHITQATPDSPTNLQFIIDALTPKEQREKKPLDLNISSALIRRSKISYDILSEPYAPAGTFDSNHISLQDITASIAIKELTNESLDAHIKRMSFKEQSGLEVNKFTARIHADKENITLSKIWLELPHSQLHINNATAHFHIGPSGMISPYKSTVDIAIEPSVVTLSDIAAFVPSLRQVNTPINLSAHIQGSMAAINIKDLKLQYGNNDINFYTNAHIDNLIRPSKLTIDCNPVIITTGTNGAYRLAKELNINNNRVEAILQNLGATNINGNISGNIYDAKANMQLYSQIGDAQLNIALHNDTTTHTYTCNGFVGSDGIQLAQILGEESGWGATAFSCDINSALRNNTLKRLDVDGNIDYLQYNNYNYNNITIDATYDNKRFDGSVKLDDTNGYVNINGVMQFNDNDALADLNITCDKLNLQAMNLIKGYEEYTLSFNADANFIGNRLDNANGYIKIEDIAFGKPDDMFMCEHITINADNDSYPQFISITSDYINGTLIGKYSFSTLPQTFQNLTENILPTLFRSKRNNRASNHTPNNFDINLTINPNVDMARILKLPFTLTDSVQIDANFNDSNLRAMLGISAPNIWIGRNHLDGLFVKVDRYNQQVDLLAQTNLQQINGNSTSLSLNGKAFNDRIDLDINWKGNNDKTYSGDIKLRTQMAPNRQDKSKTDIVTSILPSNIIINDSIWNIKPATIGLINDNINISRVEISRPEQRIGIDGIISRNPQDTLHVDLQRISLDYIFNTLNIQFVTFGGKATGRIDVADLLGKTPYLRTKELNIKDFSYNSTTLGDLSLYSMLDVEDMGILLKGIITNKAQQESFVDGYIYPTRDSLAISFDVDHIPLRFIEPFLQQIVSDVDGSASGHIFLGGTFADIYIEGEAMAHNASFTVPFLNANYHFTDSIFFDKDCIRFDDVTAYDIYDNSAQVDGYVRHDYFRNLDYNINIHDTDNILLFDVPRTTGMMYYGTIYGTGQAIISGDDYNTNVAVNMTTDPGSNFTFAIASTGNAVDYPFLTFTNRREKKEQEVLSNSSKLDSIVIENNNIVKKNIVQEKQPAVLNLSLVANITPSANINIVMNEMTGDNLSGTGEGVLRLEYNTVDNEVGMYGNYVINNGKYDFSIEDIISRKFTITPGSQVGFQGDPLKANLDIEAIYTVQANLADLDQSFSTDGELTRTSVPVNTILDIEGELTKPNIGLNIELPTLSADTDHKMRSIISTTEMLHQQIIYLLVLNRFYTPDYNTGQNENNELSSIATSTLSSSIGSLMGEFSDTWSISPNLRSDRGDFTDFEFDLFLSSRLFNDKLIFNGNLGYRNSQYSTTNFIGEYEIEYLLNESGTLRIKNYNHFNDRNYTMRTALTTQGLGIVYKHDFNTWRNFFEFTKRNRKKKDRSKDENAIATPVEQKVDTVITTIPDILE